LNCNGVPAGTLNALSAKLIKHDSRATPQALSDQDEQTPDEERDVNKTCQSCRKCPICCYYVLQSYNLLTDSCYHL